MLNGFAYEAEDEVVTGQNLHTIWAEKYRPTTFSEFIGNDSVKSKLQEFVDNKDVPSIVLHGHAGTGKCLDFSEYIDI